MRRGVQMSSKKAQGISVNTIIIAAIALIVLVVLVMIFTGRMGVFTTGIGKAGDASKTCSELDGALIKGTPANPPTCDRGKSTLISKDSVGVPDTLCCEK